jgi:hypothetical protein
MKFLTTAVSEALPSLSVTALYTLQCDDNAIKQLTGEPDLKPLRLTICSQASSCPQACRRFKTLLSLYFALGLQLSGPSTVPNQPHSLLTKPLHRQSFIH